MSTVVEAHPRPRGWQQRAAQLGRSVGLPVLAFIVVFTLVSTCVGLLITHHPDSAVVRFDMDVARDIAAHRTAAINRLTAIATVPADSIAVAVLWIGAMVFATWRTRNVLFPVFFLATIGSEKLIYFITSQIVGRPRPPVGPLGHVYATGSWPSGHVGSAVTLYGCIVLAILCHRAMTSGRWPGRPALIALGAAVATMAMLVVFSRVYRGHHFITDVTWGTLLGCTCLVVGWHVTLGPLARRARRRSEASSVAPGSGGSLTTGRPLRG